MSMLLHAGGIPSPGEKLLQHLQKAVHGNVTVFRADFILFHGDFKTGSWGRYCLPGPAGRRHGRKRKALIIRHHLNNDVDSRAFFACKSTSLFIIY